MLFCTSEHLSVCLTIFLSSVTEHRVNLAGISFPSLNRLETVTIETERPESDAGTSVPLVHHFRGKEGVDGRTIQCTVQQDGNIRRPLGVLSALVESKTITL